MPRNLGPSEMRTVGVPKFRDTPCHRFSGICRGTRRRRAGAYSPRKGKTHINAKPLFLLLHKIVERRQGPISNLTLHGFMSRRPGAARPIWEFPYSGQCVETPISGFSGNPPDEYSGFQTVSLGNGDPEILEPPFSASGLSLGGRPAPAQMGVRNPSDTLVFISRPEWLRRLTVLSIVSLVDSPCS
jgi:hypothetical protein